MPPGPSNPLGTRWIEFLPTYGIHGTDRAWSIEYPVSGGCVRMYNPDVVELYELVDIGTPVTVSYQTLVISEKADGLYLTVYSDIYEKNTSTKETLYSLLGSYHNRYPLITKPGWPIAVEFRQSEKLSWQTLPAKRKNEPPGEANAHPRGFVYV